MLTKNVEDSQFNPALRVVGLVPGGPAQKAEISIGDTIVGFEGGIVPNAHDLAKTIREINSSREVEFRIRKSGSELSRFVKVGGMP